MDIESIKSIALEMKKWLLIFWGLAVISGILGLIPVLACLNLFILIAEIILIGYMGYLLAEKGRTIIDVASVTSIAYIPAAIIEFIFYMIKLFLWRNFLSSVIGYGNMYLGAGWGIIGFVISFIISWIFLIVIGIIGYYIHKIAKK